MKTIISIVGIFALAVLSRAAPVALSLSTNAVGIVNALAALDGVDRVVEVVENGQSVTKTVRTPYDFGKDSVRIRLAIRKDILALTEAYEAYQKSRVGYIKEFFGVDTMTKDEFDKQPTEKRDAFVKKMTPLMEPTTIELELFTSADVTTFAAAGVPGTVSVALEPLVENPKK